MSCLRFLLVLGLALSSRYAVAACGNLSNVCSFSELTACCGAGSICDIDGTITMTPGATCTLDFGARSVNILSGGEIRAGTGHTTILATNLALKGSGRLSAAGDATHEAGSLRLGTQLRPLTSFSMDNTAAVNVTGGGGLGGGVLDVVATNLIELLSGSIDASALSTVSNGGDIRLVAHRGNRAGRRRHDPPAGEDEDHHRQRR
jgi:hypothetical protein